MTDSPKPKRRWFQFSLRTLLLSTAASAALLWLWTIYAAPYRAQSRAALQSPSRPYSRVPLPTTFESPSDTRRRQTASSVTRDVFA